MKYDGLLNGPVLRDIRKCKGLTIEDVSYRTGISTSTLSQLEQGGRNLSMKTLYALMEVYDTDANTLLDIRSKDKEESIDAKLLKVSNEQRVFLQRTFIYMLEQAVVMA